MTLLLLVNIPEKSILRCTPYKVSVGALS